MNTSLGAWVLAIRPKTLFASLAPVVLGTAWAFHCGSFRGEEAICALVAAFGIQIGTNLANDYYDARKGSDREDRVGPVRVVAAGLLPARSVFIGMLVAFLVAALAGLILASRAGGIVIVIGAVSIACGILYTAGPFSLAYLGLGDFFSFFFFGCVATAGTSFVQTKAWAPEPWLLGMLPGFYSVALLALNNLRDYEADVRSRKKTLIVRLGRKFGRLEIAVCLLAPALAGWMLWPWASAGAAVSTSAAALVFGIPLARRIWTIQDPASYNALFPATAAASLVVCLCAATGLVLTR